MYVAQPFAHDRSLQHNKHSYQRPDIVAGNTSVAPCEPTFIFCLVLLFINSNPPPSKPYIAPIMGIGIARFIVWTHPNGHL